MRLLHTRVLDGIGGLLRRNPHPSDDDIREALGSNICRCTGYVKIIEAVQHAATLAADGLKP